MRQVVAIVILSIAVVFSANATNNDDIQHGIFDSYLKLANDGDVVAQYVVAQRYETGRGTEKDMEKAYHWYEVAAKQKYPLAVVKLEERNKEQAKPEPVSTPKPKLVAQEPAPAPIKKHVKKEPEKKPKPAAPHKVISENPKTVTTVVPVAAVQAPPVPVSKPKPAEPMVRPEAVKQEVKVPAPETVVAKVAIAEEPPKPVINVMQTLLAGKWKRNQQEAEFLPSSRATCLQSGNAEAVCFSQELTRNVDNAGLTYNVKSVISGTNNKEARFNLRFIYNVVNVSSKPFANPVGMLSDVDDMKVKTGWQEPGVGMECHIRDERSLTCIRADRKTTYQFVRN